MTRRHGAAVILVVWAVALAWLVKRVYLQSTGARLAEAALSVEPGATYYRLDAGGTQIGYASTTIDTMPDSLRVIDAAVTEIAADGRIHRTVSRSEARLSRTLRLETIDVSYEEDGRRYTARGTFTPDSMLHLAVSAAGFTARTDLKLRRTPVLPSLLPLRLAFGGDLTVGNTYSIRLFEAPLLLERDLHIRVAAETTLSTPDSATYDSTTMSWVTAHLDTTPTFRVDAGGPGGGSPIRIWIDAQGRIVKEEYPSGTVLTRTAFEMAVQNFRHRDTLRIAQASRRPRPGAIEPMAPPGTPSDVPPLAELRAVLTGPPPAAFDVAGDGQSVVGDTVTVHRVPVESLTPGFQLPFRDSLFRDQLRAEPLLPVAAPEVGFPLMKLVGSERDPVRVAGLLTHWVARRLTPDTSALRPEPLLALAAGTGDVDAVTGLYVTMARSVGLPARAVAGVRRVGARFYYYSWPEVWLGRWVPVDPRDDQFPADASHLRLVIGVPARQAVLAARLGTLTLEAQ